MRTNKALIPINSLNKPPNKGPMRLPLTEAVEIVARACAALALGEMIATNITAVEIKPDTTPVKARMMMICSTFCTKASAKVSTAIPKLARKSIILQPKRELNAPQRGEKTAISKEVIPKHKPE